MRSISAEARDRLNDNSTVLLKGTLRFADGTVMELSDGDYMVQTACFSTATSDSSGFAIGACVIGSFSATLLNWSRKFDECDFEGATLEQHVGVPLGSGGVEWVFMGTYTVEQPSTYGNTIALECLDFMAKFEVPFSEVGTRFPASAASVVSDMCARCGVRLEALGFDGHDLWLHGSPGESDTCLKVLSDVAQATGNFAKMTPEGSLSLQWYDTSAFEGESWLDGEGFDGAAPYASGDAADGGDFLDYSGGDAADGGWFLSQGYASLRGISDMSVYTDDIVVTGLSVTAADEALEGGAVGASGETRLHGSEGYVLSISGNPLVGYGHAEEVAALVGAKVVGMRFRPFDASTLGTPVVEAGDAVVIIDHRNRVYRSYATRVVYKTGAYMATACEAEYPGRNRSAGYSALTDAIVRARNAVRAERSAREEAAEEMAERMSKQAGTYMTDEVQPDGSHVYYLHDRPTIAASRILWKMGAQGFAISLDGGKSFTYGLDVSGAAILERVYAIGINADHIVTGEIRSEDGKSYWNLKSNVLQTHNMIATNMKATGSVEAMDYNQLKSCHLYDGRVAFYDRESVDDGWTLRGHVGALLGGFVAQGTTGARFLAGVNGTGPGLYIEYSRDKPRESTIRLTTYYESEGSYPGQAFIDMGAGSRIIMTAMNGSASSSRLWVATNYCLMSARDSSRFSSIEIRPGEFRINPAESLWMNGRQGFSGTFKDADGNTRRVRNGIITTS